MFADTSSSCTNCTLKLDQIWTFNTAQHPGKEHACDVQDSNFERAQHGSWLVMWLVGDLLAAWLGMCTSLQMHLCLDLLSDRSAHCMQPHSTALCSKVVSLQHAIAGAAVAKWQRNIRQSQSCTSVTCELPTKSQHRTSTDRWQESVNNLLPRHACFSMSVR